MVPSLLLALTVIIVMIDVLVGIHRGFQYSLVRLLIWIAGTFIALIVARSVTVFVLLKLAKVPNMNLFAFDVFGSRLNTLTDSVGTHLSGVTVSFAVPIVFSALFIITKFFSWIIYLFVKKLIIKSAKKATAHNAAVDAVKAVESSEMPDIESAAIEQPVVLTRINSDHPDDPEFGSFGIYPKEETDVQTAADPEFGTFGIYPKNDTVSTDLTVITEEDPDSDKPVYEPIREEENETLENEETEETEDDQDGFESIESLEDGFESLARASVLEEERDKQKKEKRRNAQKKQPKVKKFIPPKQKKLKKKHSFSFFLTQKSVASGVFGGVLGAFIAVYSCAIIAAPFSAVVRIIADEKVADDAVDVITTALNEDVGELLENAFIKSEPKNDNYPKVFEISESFSLRPEDFTEVFNTADESVVHYIYKYTGADFVASSIYDSLSPVTSEETELPNKGIDIYNFPESLKYYAKYIPQLKSLIDTLHKGEGLSMEVVDTVESSLKLLFKTGEKGDLLTQTDKLSVANTIVDTLDGIIKKQIGPKSSDRVLDRFDSYDQIDSGMSAVFNEVRRLIRLGFFEN